MKIIALSDGSQLKANLFLSVRFAISLIPRLSFTPNFVVHIVCIAADSFPFSGGAEIEQASEGARLE